MKSAQNRVLIKGGKVVNDDEVIIADVYVENGKIQQVGQDLMIPGGAKVVDATNKFVIPGGIDTQTHLHHLDPSFISCDDFYTGTKAALAGGTTMIFDVVIPARGEYLVDALSKWKKFAESRACCDYSFHIALSSWSESIKEGITEMVQDKGINSFQIISKSPSLSDEQLINLLKHIKELGGLPILHPENQAMIAHLETKIKSMLISGPEGYLFSRPEEVETEITNKSICLASFQNCPILVSSVMNKSVSDVITSAQRSGKVVFGEVCCAAIATDGNAYFNEHCNKAASIVTSPTLRPDATICKHLINTLSTNSLHTTCSNHCTFDQSQKMLGKDDFQKIPSGINGVEERMSILWTKGVVEGSMDECKFVAATSSNAAKIYNLYPRKGRIAEGSDADIVVWDPTVSHNISKETQNNACDYNAFEGMKLVGKAVHVLSLGNVVVENGMLRVAQGSGRFISRKPNARFLYAALQNRDNQYRSIIRDDQRETVRNQHAESAGAEIEEVQKPVKDVPIKHDLHKSSFEISGKQVDDNQPVRNSSRVIKAPGGGSSISFY